MLRAPGGQKVAGAPLLSLVWAAGIPFASPGAAAVLPSKTLPKPCPCAEGRARVGRQPQAWARLPSREKHTRQRGNTLFFWLFCFRKGGKNRLLIKEVGQRVEEEPGTAPVFPRLPRCKPAAAPGGMWGADLPHAGGCRFTPAPSMAGLRRCSPGLCPTGTWRRCSGTPQPPLLSRTNGPFPLSPPPPPHPPWSRPPRAPPAFPPSPAHRRSRPLIGCGAGGRQPMGAPRVAVSLGQKTQAGRGRARARGRGHGAAAGAGARAAAAEGAGAGPEGAAELRAHPGGCGRSRASASPAPRPCTSPAPRPEPSAPLPAASSPRPGVSRQPRPLLSAAVGPGRRHGFGRSTEC